MGVKVREKKRDSGEFWVFIHHKGLRTSRCVGSRAAAEKVAEIIQARITLGDFGMDDLQDEEAPHTMAEHAAIWLATSIEGVLDDATHERYREVLKRDIIPALGGKSLPDITVANIKGLLNKLVREGRTTKSVSLVRTVLSSCLQDAVENEVISTNPMAGFRHNRRRSKTVETHGKKQKEINPLTEEETHHFLTVGMQKSPVMYGPMFLCDFRAGLRLGELIALHWDDILWEKGVIHVQRSYKRGKLKRPKFGRTRMVDMSDQLRGVLKDLRQAREREAARKGKEVSPIIFHYRGHYRAQNTVRKAFKTMLKRAALREIRVHDMRHTYASHLISRGVSLAYIKDQLGHKSIKTTVDTYGHLVPGSNRAAVNSLDRPLGDAPGGVTSPEPRQPM